MSGAERHDQSAAPVVDPDGAVRTGLVLTAILEPVGGHAADLLEWYRSDHLPTAGAAAPGVFAADTFFDPATGRLLGIYLSLAGFEADRQAFAAGQVQRAAAEDRLFSDRIHLHTWTHEPVGEHFGDTPLGLALGRRPDWAAVLALDPAGGSSREQADARDVAASLGEAFDLVSGSVLLPVQQVMPSAFDEHHPPAEGRLCLLVLGRGSTPTAEELAASPPVTWAAPFTWM